MTLSILATAGFVDRDPVEHALVQSDYRRGILHTRAVNERRRTVTRYRLRWPSATFAQAIALRAHHSANAHSEIRFQPPGAPIALSVIYLGPPAVRFINAASCSMSAVVEEAPTID